MEPYRIICTTCEARLKVFKEKAIGQVLACPRCQSMVLVTPPEELSSPSSSAPTADAWASPVERLWQKTILWGAGGVAGVVLVGGVVGVWLTRPSDDPPPPAAVSRAPTIATPEEIAADAVPVPTVVAEKLPVVAPVETAAAEEAAPDEFVAVVDEVDSKDVEADVAEEPPTVVVASHEEPAESPRASSNEAELAVDESSAELSVASGVAVVRHDGTTATVVTSADVIDRLGLTLPRVDFKAVSLVDFLDFISELVHVPITLDLDSLEAAGAGPTDMMSVHAEESSVAELLASALSGRGLVYTVEEGHVIVTGKQPSRQEGRGPSSAIAAPESGMSDALARRVTFTFLQPTRLVRLASFLEEVADVTITVDWQSLAAVDFTLDTRISCAVEDRPLGEALTAVLEPLGLSWRAAGGRILQIISSTSADTAVRHQR